jgi:hypothetical protein
VARIELAIQRFNWDALRTFDGFAGRLPDAMRELMGSRDAHEAERASGRIEASVLMDDCLCEACFAVSACLVAGLDEVASPARRAVLELLARIGSGQACEPAGENVGKVDVDACATVIASGFALYSSILVNGSEPNERLACIDLVTISGRADRRFRDAAISALELALRSSQLEQAERLIRASIQDIKRVGCTGNGPM